MADRQFRIESGANQDGLRLAFRDEPSGVTLAEVRLDAEQLWGLLRGGQIRVDGTGTEHFERIGKAMLTEVVKVPKEVLASLGFSASKEAQLQAGADWATVTYPGWTRYEARATNMAGVRVVMRKWVEA